jgi:hypothetical protein
LAEAVVVGTPDQMKGAVEAVPVKYKKVNKYSLLVLLTP